MAESTATDTPQTNAAKGHFAKAVEEAKAGVQALGKDAQGRADQYREKFQAKSDTWSEEAKVRTGEARTRATELARDGNAALLDEKVGVKYGDYARTAARSMHDTAARLDAKELDELAEDAKEFVRKSPGLAVGIAAVAGFMLARLFTSGKD
jgi:ElaB/YqjD/DUF883 family membrane-anchored ribosome-binding protein